MNEEKIMIKLEDAINAGKGKKGNIQRIPVFKSIQEIDGELYGIIEGYSDSSEHLFKDTNTLLN